MPLFEYEAVDVKGRKIKQKIEATDRNELLSKLREQNLIVLNVKELKSKAKKKKNKAKNKKKKGKTILEINLDLPFIGGLSSKDLSILSKQLGALIEAGIGIVDALELVADAIDNPFLKKELPKIAEEVRGGEALSKALSKRKDKFGELFVSMVEVGEETGQLDKVFKELSEYYKRIAEIINKIKSASYYPIFVLISSSSITFGIIYFLVPTFAQIYSSMGGQLPAITQMLVNASNWLQENVGKFFIGLFVFLAIFFFLYKKVYTFKKFMHWIQLKLPVFGPLFVKSAIAKLSRTFSTLFSSGVSVERALELSAKVAGNVIYQEAIESVKDAVLKGEPIWQAFQKTKRFPKMFVAMVKIGEETGQLDSMLQSLADFYEDEVKTTIDGLISMIEPMMMVLIGGIVGFILVALYMPIFKMGDLISGG